MPFHNFSASAAEVQAPISTRWQTISPGCKKVSSPRWRASARVSTQRTVTLIDLLGEGLRADGVLERVPHRRGLIGDGPGFRRRKRLGFDRQAEGRGAEWHRERHE